MGKKANVEDVQRELAEVKEELERAKAEAIAEHQRATVQKAASDGELAEREEQLRKELQAQREALETQLEAQRELQKTELAAAHGASSDAQARTQTELAERATALEEAQRRIGEREHELAEAAKAREALEAQLAETARKAEAATSAVLRMDQDAHAAKRFLDLAIGECEFASPFAYFVVVKLRMRGEEHSTDVSAPSERPVFDRSSFMLQCDEAAAQDVLQVSAYVSVPDPVASAAAPTSRLLGDVDIPLEELVVPAGGNVSRRVVRSISFMRDARARFTEAAGSRPVAVGKATVAMQIKVLSSFEAASTIAAKTAAAKVANAPLPSSFPPLDKPLWLPALLQPRLRALVHGASALPAPPEGGHATARVTLRLVRSDGQVLHESASSDAPLMLRGPGTDQFGGATAASAEVRFAQEVVLPLNAAIGGQDVSIHLALDVISVTNEDGGATTASLLDLRWRAESLPLFQPVHLHARTSAEQSSVPSYARPRPRLLVSLVREPGHDELESLSRVDGSSAVEIRVHGVPLSRPMPAAVGNALVAVCPQLSAGQASDGSPEIPVATYLYDQRLDFTAFLESHFCSSTGQGLGYFLTPAVRFSHTPQWGQFVLRFLARLVTGAPLSVFVIDLASIVPDSDRPLHGALLGFASLDAASLLQGQASATDPPQRSFLLDLRLMDAPGAPTSLEVECRVWPSGAGVASSAQICARSAALSISARSPAAGGVSARTAAGGSALGAATRAEDMSEVCVPLDGASAAARDAALNLQREAHEFRFNHELSVELAKEFNLRAAALKRAGEEIVALRRQLQLLKSENVRLKAQLDDEERLAEEVQSRPPPAGLEDLSHVELAQKLQRALEKYREEKAKGAELSQRLEEALREASRGRGLERALDELETAHLEQNAELQRMQDEGRKLDAYRETAKTQEKVIGKLERILESSLQEVQAAQRAQLDVERLKTENVRLRERCAAIVSRRQAVAGQEDAAELGRLVVERDGEITRLEAVIREHQRGQVGAGGASQGPGPELAREHRRLEEMEAAKGEWENKCNSAEQRMNMLHKQLTESSRKYGAEISALKVEVAKRDAQIKEFIYILGQAGDAGATSAARP